MLENGAAERPVYSSQETFGDAGSMTLPRPEGSLTARCVDCRSGLLTGHRPETQSKRQFPRSANFRVGEEVVLLTPHRPHRAGLPQWVRQARFTSLSRRE